MKRHSIWLRRLILAPRSHLQRLTISVAMIAGAALLRLAIDGGGNGVPFITFLPVIIIGALLFDWRYGVFIAALSSVVVDQMFLGGFWLLNPDIARTAILVLYTLTAGLLIVIGGLVRSLLSEVDELMTTQGLFNRELQHRIKNSLSIVQALASQGVRAKDPKAFYRDLSGRLAALAKANELLSIGSQQDCRLPELAVQAVAPFNGEGHIALLGDPCTVPRDTCLPLVMVLHELCTNALKHGALSAAQGTVALAWRIESSGAQRALVLEWQEAGGPPVETPAHRGLGSRLLVPQKGIDAVKLVYAPGGVRCEMTVGLGN